MPSLPFHLMQTRSHVLKALVSDNVPNGGDDRTSKRTLSRWKFPTSIDASTRKAIVSASLFVLFDVLFRKLFVRLNLSFPSSLAGCALLFTFLLVLPERLSESVFALLEPGALLIGAKWLPVFFVPSLVTLPLTDPLGSTAELVKTALVVVGGFLFTLVSTAYSVVAVRKLVESTEKQGQDKINSSSSSSSSSNKLESDIMKKMRGDSKATTAGKESLTRTKQQLTSAPAQPLPKAFSDELFHSLLAITLFTGVGSVATSILRVGSVLPKRISALFLLSSTLTSFVFGARLPKKLTKIVHPLVTCTALTWTAASALAIVRGKSFRSILRSYRTGSLSPLTTGAGDILLFLLGPAVVSLAISMYSRRKLMADNLPAVATGVGVSTFGGIFGTALAVRLLDMGNPMLRLALLSRNITSPLAMTIASIIGADVSLAVSMVVVTGLIGANFGASLLSLLRIKDPVARGLGIGAAAHGLGTAAFANEMDAFPFAAIAMALTGAAATVTVSIPVLRRIILQLALGC